eukprot:2771750-Prymnesium_polylepis.3
MASLTEKLRETAKHEAFQTPAVSLAFCFANESASLSDDGGSGSSSYHSISSILGTSAGANPLRFALVIEKADRPCSRRRTTDAAYARLLKNHVPIHVQRNTVSVVWPSELDKFGMMNVQSPLSSQ